MLFRYGLSCVCAIFYNVFLRFVEVDVIDNEEIGPGVPSYVEDEYRVQAQDVHLL